MKKLFTIITIVLVFCTLHTRKSFAQQLTLPQQYSCVNDTIIIPINYSNILSLGALTLNISFDTAVLTYVGSANTSPLTPGLLCGVPTSGPDAWKVVVLWVDGTNNGVNLVSGKLCDLKFKYKGGGTNLNFLASSDLVKSNLDPIFPTYINGIINPTLITQPISTLVCENSPASFSLTAAIGSTFQWQIQNGVLWDTVQNNTSYSGVNTNTLHILQALNSLNNKIYKCRVTKTCTQSTNPVTLTVDPKPTIVLNNDTSICTGSFVTLHGNGTTGTGTLLFHWDQGLGNGITKTVNPTLTTIYHLTVTDTNNCGSTDSVVINVNPLPSYAGPIIGLTTLCHVLNVVTYSVPNITNATSYIWSLPPNGSGTSASNSIVVNYTSETSLGNITVKGHNSCGDGIPYSLAISVNPVQSFSETYTICAGGSYFWHGTAYSTAGTYTANYLNSIGCDSNYTLHLYVNSVFTFSENHSICQGESYPWQENTYTSAGTYFANFTSNLGCDSSYTLHLFVNPTYAFSENHNICQGESHPWQGNTYTSAGTYFANFTSSMGCDSNYTLHLFVNPTYAFSENHSICQGESHPWQGNTYTSAGTYFANYISSTGCDSNYTLHLFVNPVFAGSENHNICQGESYPWHGNTFTSAGTYFANFTSSTGCDSSYTLHLFVNPTYAFSENHSICQGENYPWHGNTYSIAGTYFANYISSTGCDSTYTLQLIVNTVQIGVTLIGTELIANAIANSYQWIDCNNNFSTINNEINQTFAPTVNGNYAVIVSQGSCSDTSACMDILTIGIEDNVINNVISVYPNPMSNEFIIEFTGNTKSCKFDIFNSIGQIVFEGHLTDKTVVQTSTFAAGVYLLKIELDNHFELIKLVKQ